MPRTARVWADLRAERVERLEQHGEDAKLPSSTRCEEPAKQTGYLRVEIKGDVCGRSGCAQGALTRSNPKLIAHVQRGYGVLRTVRRGDKVDPTAAVCDFTASLIPA